MLYCTVVQTVGYVGTLTVRVTGHMGGHNTRCGGQDYDVLQLLGDDLDMMMYRYDSSLITALTLKMKNSNILLFPLSIR